VTAFDAITAAPAAAAVPADVYDAEDVAADVLVRVDSVIDWSPRKGQYRGDGESAPPEAPTSAGVLSAEAPIAAESSDIWTWDDEENVQSSVEAVGGEELPIAAAFASHPQLVAALERPDTGHAATVISSAWRGYAARRQFAATVASKTHELMHQSVALVDQLQAAAVAQPREARVVHAAPPPSPVSTVEQPQPQPQAVPPAPEFVLDEDRLRFERALAAAAESAAQRKRQQDMEDAQQEISAALAAPSSASTSAAASPAASPRFARLGARSSVASVASDFSMASGMSMSSSSVASSVTRPAVLAPAGSTMSSKREARARVKAAARAADNAKAAAQRAAAEQAAAAERAALEAKAKAAAEEAARVAAEATERAVHKARVDAAAAALLRQREQQRIQAEAAAHALAEAEAARKAEEERQRLREVEAQEAQEKARLAAEAAIQAASNASASRAHASSPPDARTPSTASSPEEHRPATRATTTVLQPSPPSAPPAGPAMQPALAVSPFSGDDAVASRQRVEAAAFAAAAAALASKAKVKALTRARQRAQGGVPAAVESAAVRSPSPAPPAPLVASAKEAQAGQQPGVTSTEIVAVAASPLAATVTTPKGSKKLRKFKSDALNPEKLAAAAMVRANVTAKRLAAEAATGEKSASATAASKLNWEALEASLEEARQNAAQPTEVSLLVPSMPQRPSLAAVAAIAKTAADAGMPFPIGGVGASTGANGMTGDPEGDENEDVVARAMRAAINRTLAMRQAAAQKKSGETPRGGEEIQADSGTKQLVGPVAKPSPSRVADEFSEITPADNVPGAPLPPHVLAAQATAAQAAAESAAANARAKAANLAQAMRTAEEKTAAEVAAHAKAHALLEAAQAAHAQALAVGGVGVDGKVLGAIKLTKRDLVAANISATRAMAEAQLEQKLGKPLEVAAKELQAKGTLSPLASPPQSSKTTNSASFEIAPASAQDTDINHAHRYPFGRAPMKDKPVSFDELQPAPAPADDASDEVAAAAVRARARRAARDRAVADVEQAALARHRRNPFNSMSSAELRALALSRVRRRAAVARSIAATTPMLPAAKARLFGVVAAASTVVKRTAAALSLAQRRNATEEAAALRIQRRVRGMLARRATSALRAQQRLEHALEVAPVVTSALTPHMLESCLGDLKSALAASEGRGNAGGAHTNVGPQKRSAHGGASGPGATAEELLRIYQDEGEAAALEFAAKEALLWTHYLLDPPPAEGPRTQQAEEGAADAAPVSVVPSTSALSAEVNGFFKPSARAAATAVVTSPNAKKNAGRKSASAVILVGATPRSARAGADSDDEEDEEEEELVRIARAKLAAKHSQPAALPKRQLRTGPPMNRERAIVVIQAFMRGLIARRWAEVQRCRLDLRAAVSEAKERPDEPHPEVIQCMLDLGEAYLRAWDPHNAEQAYSVALESIEREYGSGDHRCRKPAEILARIFADRGDVNLAEEVLHRALGNTRNRPEPANEEERLAYEEYEKSGPLQMVFNLGAWIAAADGDGDVLA